MATADELLDLFADVLADRVAEKMAKREQDTTARVYRDDAKTHGCTWRWVEDRAREGLITMHGPRGRRFVFASELARLVVNTTIKTGVRARRVEIQEKAEDAKAAVLELANRRLP